MIKQRTIAKTAACEGIGLHSGKPTTLAIHPAGADTGIVFRRLDVDAQTAYVPARYDRVTDTMLGTTIENAHGVSVATIEHLMAALWGAGIDNAIIELGGPEVPIMDGSSEPFMQLIEAAGTRALSAPRRLIRVLKPIEVRDGASVARIAPNREGDEGLVLDVEIDFSHPLIRRQRATFDFRDTGFGEALSAARTFGFAHEVEQLRALGLARGGSLENAVVVGEQGVLNPEGLRFDDEFLRHKALDCIGDLFLAGYRIDGHVSASRPGHRINNLLLRALLADDGAYAIVRAGSALPAPVSGEPRTPAYA